MRIALVANAYPPFFVGGAEIAAHRQAVELVRRGHRVSAFCAWSNDAERPYDVTLHEVDGVAVTRINVPGFRFTPAYGFKNGVVDALFARFLENERPDVVHVHNLPGLSVGVMDEAEAAGVPMMATFHDHWGFCLRNTLVRPGETRVCPDWSACEACLPEANLEGLALPTFMRTNLIRLKLHKAARFHFPSRYLMEAYGQALFDRRRSVQHTYGIQPQWFEGDVRRPPSSVIELAFVAYLGPHKGPDVLLDALERVEAAGRLHAFRVGFYGHGIAEKAIQERIDLRGWRGRVILHGKRSPAEMMAVYRAADVMVNCSRWPENEPLTLLESLASGTPVIATAIGGNIELVRDRENGWLTGPGDAADLARRLIELASDPAALAALRPAARASVNDRTLAAYADFAEAGYAGLKTAAAKDIPSIIAVVGDDYGAVDVAALRRASRSGVWGEAEWVPAESLAGEAERGALRAVVGLNGKAFGSAAVALADGAPAFAVGRDGLRALGGARDLRYVADFDALADLGRTALTREKVPQSA